MLSVQHLTTGYGKKQVLSDVSFEVSKGCLVLLTGGNGSGKSTLLKAIYGLLSPWKNDSGVACKIIFDGIDITNTPTSDLLKLGIVYMPQKKNVFDDFTVEENLLTAASIYTKDSARKRIKDVFTMLPRLAELRNRTPFLMSGGERQLLAFGCTLLHSPKLMLLDEPFAGVDKYTCNVMQYIIMDLMKNSKTVLMVEHNELLIKDYTKMKLYLGQILE